MIVRIAPIGSLLCGLLTRPTKKTGTGITPWVPTVHRLFASAGHTADLTHSGMYFHYTTGWGHVKVHPRWRTLGRVGSSLCYDLAIRFCAASAAAVCTV